MMKLHFASAVTVLAIVISVRSASAAALTDVTITASAPSFRAGASAVYLVTVANIGRASTNDTITVSARVPEGLLVGSSAAGNWNCTVSSELLLACTNPGPLRPRSRSILRLRVRVGNVAGSAIATAFTVDYAGDTNPLNNTVVRTSIVRAGVRGPRPRHAPISAPVSPQQANAAATDLVMIKTIGNETFRVGATGAYKLTVRNAGPAATDAPITVTDPLPDGLGFVSAVGADWACAVSQGTVNCVTQGPLASGSETSIVVRVTVGGAAYPTTTNTATLAYAGDTDAANNVGKRPTTVRLALPPPAGATATPTSATPISVPTSTPTPTFTPGSVAVTDLLLTATIDGTFRVGSTAGYSITVTNLGPDTSNAGITVTDILPGGLTFASVQDPSWVCSSAGQIVTCATSNQLAVGANLGLRLALDVGAAAYPTVTNVVQLAYPGDSNLANNTRRVPTTVRQ
jgi:uncharacterized repeat protein (TIGR01451 family)